MSSGLTLAVVGAPDIAKDLAKKSTQSDITLYHQVQDGHALSLVEPSAYPEKFQSLLYSLAMSDRALFVVHSLDRATAETAATLDLFDLPVEIRFGSSVGEEEIRKAFKGLRIASAPAAPFDLLKLRSEILEWRATRPEGPVEVGLDHSFPVKGVGTVALGFVRQGTLLAHATLRLYPTEKSVEIRSVQVHDVDVKGAVAGERVGLALKGAEVDELSRGQVLAPDGALRTGVTIEGRSGRTCPYYRGDLRAGAQLHALVGSYFVPAGVTTKEGDRLSATCDRTVAWRPGERFLLADLSVPQGPRCVGSWTL
jgi:selenocysteine-specific translation elongation factor